MSMTRQEQLDAGYTPYELACAYYDAMASGQLPVPEVKS